MAIKTTDHKVEKAGALWKDALAQFRECEHKALEHPTAENMRALDKAHAAEREAWDAYATAVATREDVDA